MKRTVNDRTNHGALWSCLRLMVPVCLLICGWTATVLAAGGDIEWQYRDSQTGKQTAVAAALDPAAGELAITGYTDAAGNDDIYTVKIKADGTGLQWAAPPIDISGSEDRAAAIAVDSQGDVIVTGHVTNASANIDIYTVKYSGVNGAVLWTKTYAGAGGGNDFPTAVAVDYLDNIYIGGFTPGTNGKDDGLVVKYSPDGSQMWVRTYNNAVDNDHDRVADITAGTDGIALTGKTLRTAGDWDILTVKYDFNGTKKWETIRTGTNGNDEGIGVAMDSSGNVIVTGTVLNAASNNDIYTVKYDGTTGTVVSGMEWTYADPNGGTDQARDLVVDTDDDIVVTGSTYTSTGLYDFITLRYSGSSGAVLWGPIIYSSGGDNTDIPEFMAVDNDSVVVTGPMTKTGADVDFTTIKYSRDTGHELWPAAATYNNTAVNKDDHPVYVGFDTNGKIYVAGWSDKSTTSALDYDYYAIRYDPGALNAPTNLQAVAADETTVNLTWDDNSISPNEDEFRIERKVGAGGTYAQIAVTAQDAVTYQDTGLTPHTMYYYRVRGYNTTLGEYSHYCPEAYAKTTIVTVNTQPHWLVFYNGPDNGDDTAQGIAVGPDMNPVVTGFSTIANNFDYYTVKLRRDLVFSNADSVSLDLNGDGLADIKADFTTPLNADSTVVFDTTLAGVVTPGAHTGDAAGNTTLNIISVPQGNEASVNQDATGITLSWNNTTLLWSLTDNGGYTNAAVLDGYVGQIWDDHYDDPGNMDDLAKCLIVDNTNEVVVSGTAYLYSSISGTTSNDVYTRKYASSGPPAIGDPFVWEDQYNGTGANDDYAEAIAVVADPADNTAIVGYGLNAASDNDIYVMYFHDDGTRAWAREFDYAGGDDRPVSVTFDPDGDIIMTGRVTVGGDFAILTRKYCAAGTSPACTAAGKAAGDAIWTVVHDSGNGDDQPTGVVTDSSGHVYVAGFVTNGSLNKDTYLVQLDGATGAETWGAPIIENGPGNGDDRINAIRIDANDDDVVVAETWNLAAGNSEFRMVRYTAAGVPVWERQFNSPATDDVVQAMGMDVSGNFCVAGTKASGGTTDLLALKYDFAGNILGAISYDGGHAPALNDEAVGVAVNRYGDFFVAGNTTKPGAGNDYLVMLCEGDVLQAPAPFTAAPYYTTVDFTWVNNAPGTDGFTLEGKTGACPILDTDSTWQESFPSTAVSHTETGLAMGETYCFRIKTSVTATGEDSRWLSRQVMTTKPPAPISFTATPVNTTRIQLAWTDGVNGEESFRIERCMDTAANCGTIDANFSYLGDAPANSAGFDDPTVCPGQTYTYRIRAVNTLWGQEPLWAYDDAATPPTTAPALISVTANSEGRLDLAWTDTNGDETGFNIYRCQGAGCIIDTAVDSPVATVTAPKDAIFDLRMDESSWTPGQPDALDSSGNGNNGTPMGDARRGVFDGDDDYIDLGDIDALDTPAAFSAEIWFRRDAETAQATNHQINNVLIAQSSAADNDNFEIGTEGTSIELYLDTAGNVNETKSVELGLAVDAGIQNNTWYHLVFTYDKDAVDGNEAKLYLDGAPLAQWSDPEGVLADSAASPLTIGMARPDGEAVTPTGLWGDFQGEIDEVAVYNRALTQTEITDHYANGNIPTTYADSVLNPNETYRYLITAFKTTPATCGTSPGWEGAASGYNEGTTTGVVAPTLQSAAPDTIETTTHINLSWLDNTEFEENFIVERCTGDCTGSFAMNDSFTVPPNPGKGGTVNWTDTTACSGTYTYRVKAVRTTAPVWSTATSANELVATTAGPTAPVMDSAAQLNEEEIQISWTDNTSDETGFTLQRCIGASCTNLAVPAHTGTGTATFTDSRLKPYTTYTYQVRADKSAGVCSWQTGFSATGSTNTNINPEISLNTPTFPNTTEIDLSWTDPTAHETGFVLERCDGDCTSAFTATQSSATDANMTSYADTSVCEGTQYSYRVKAIDQDFEGGMNGCWSKREKMAITPFTADTVINFTVNFAAGMQTDFDDLRFYAFTDSMETDGEIVPYVIASKTDGVSAEIILRTPANGDFFYMYYGNSAAIALPENDEALLTFYDDFQGTVIDTNKWVEIDPNDQITQNNGLNLNYVDTAWNAALISKQTFARQAGTILLMKIQPQDGLSSDYFMAGWDIDQTADPNYPNMVHGLYWSNFNGLSIYAKGSNRGYSNWLPYTADTNYTMKIVLKAQGADYYLKGGVYTDWQWIGQSTLYNDDPLRIGIHQNRHQAKIELFGVIEPTHPAVAFNVETVTCDPVGMPYGWESPPSQVLTATAQAATPPASFQATPLSESEIQLQWTDTTADDTGFILERCQGSDAACTAATAPNFDWSLTVPGPVNPSLLLHMDEPSWNGTANEVTDSAGANHGRSYYGASTTTGGVNGSRAGNFGSSDCVALNSGFTLNRFGATLSWWQKPSVTTNTGLFTNSLTGATFSLIESRSSMIYAETNQNCNNFDFDGITKTTTGAWFTIVFDNEHAYLYKDGVFVKEATDYGWDACGGNAVDHMLADTTFRYIGASTYYATNYRGLLDEVTVFDYALSPLDIAYLYGSFEEYTDSGLHLSTEYTYRLRAVKNSSSCTWDTGDNVRVTASTLAPPPPTNLQAAKINTTQINLNWDDNTGSNSAFTIERSAWNGSGWDPPDFIGPADADDISYSDTTVCENTQYRYRVRAAREAFVVGGTGLSNGGGEAWARRAPIQITGFQPNSVTELTVPYDADMQSDFDDLRFFDETAGQELSHYIIYRVNAYQAQVIFKTGVNDNITMYYGNPSATDTSNGAALFEFFDDFSGTTLDSGKWVEIDPNGQISQNNGLQLSYVDNIYNAALISQQTFARTAGKTLLMRVTPQDGPGSDYFALGWGLNQTINPSYSQLRHGYYWSNFSQLRTYNPWYYGPAYTATDYMLKIELKAAGARYFIQGGAYSDLTLFHENANYTDDPLRVQIAQDSHQAGIEMIGVYDRGATAVPGTEERGLVANGWETDFTEATATTDAKVTPNLNTVTRVSEAQIHISWMDTNADETALELKRCVGASCQTITRPAGTLDYSDTGLQPNTTYCYQIRAVKTGPSCGWQTAYDPATPKCATTSVIDPVLAPTVGATTDPSNTTRVALEWTDNSEAESGFTVWRCNDDTQDCSNAANFTAIHAAGPNQNNWDDDSVCSNSTYTYAIQAVSDGLPVNGFSNNGGGAWTRKKKVIFDTFPAHSTAFVTVPYDADMQADFDDLRFVDGDGTELTYAIDSITNGVVARIWFQTEVNTTVNMLYGNPAATSSAIPETTLFAAGSFYDDFQGMIIDTNKWVEIDPNGQISQNNALQLSYVDNSWNAALISKQTFARHPGDTLYMKIRPEDGPSSDYFATGWEMDQTINPNLYQLDYGYAFWNTSFWISHKGSLSYPSHTQSYSLDTDYEIKIELKANGAAFYERTAGSVVWQLGMNSTSYNDTPLRIGIHQDSSQSKIKAVAVVTTPVVTLGPEEPTSFVAWTSARSGTDSATTAQYTKPQMDQGNTAGATETSIQLTWTDVNPDESYFRIERGAADCTGFTEIGQTAGPDILTFMDTGADLPEGMLAYNTTYCYRVQAHKDTGGCDWDTGFTTTATATTVIPVPENLIATASETTRIDLIWNDTTSSETGFIIERCDGDTTTCAVDPDNLFSPLTTVGAGITTYTDSTVCPTTTYSYRVQAVRNGEWTSGPSLSADATTPGPPVVPTNLTLTEFYNQNNDVRKINLAWDDVNPDEDGFVIERCNQTISGDCDSADTNFSPIRMAISHDEFNTEVNPVIWNQWSCLETCNVDVNRSNAAGSVHIYDNNGTAVLEATTPATAGTNKTHLAMQMTCPESLGSGDFDLQFDWDLPNPVDRTTMSPGSYHTYLRLWMAIGLDSFVMDRGVGHDADYYWGNITHDGQGVANFYDPTTTDTTGKFRVTRTGTTITLYNWDGTAGDWNVLTTFSGADIGAAPTVFQIRQTTDQHEANTTITTVIDNLKINSGIVTACADNSLEGSTDYYYRLRAYKDTACPAWDALYSTKEHDLTNPVAPTLSAAAVGSRKIKLTWPDNAADEDGYEIERVIFGGKFVKIDDVHVDKNSPGYTDPVEFTDTRNLDPDTTYTYRIRAYRDNYASYSAYSNEVSAHTDVLGGGSLDDTTCP